MALTPDRNDPNYKEMMKIKAVHPEYWNDFSKYDTAQRPPNVSDQSGAVAKEKAEIARRSGLDTKKSPKDRKLA